eukprot:TRINITY_DN9354_c0_g1_i1.p1 TRINITY_DN9354_c0_g1~~TRINITY_DN9354_c0_g1_i1.p1  ORF type:complete len:360 (+),score=109.98 TRINITY_DN9354_c0_g1_i1:137-1081(+)
MSAICALTFIVEAESAVQVLVVGSSSKMTAWDIASGEFKSEFVVGAPLQSLCCCDAVEPRTIVSGGVEGCVTMHSLSLLTPIYPADNRGFLSAEAKLSGAGFQTMNAYLEEGNGDTSLEGYIRRKPQSIADLAAPAPGPGKSVAGPPSAASEGTAAPTATSAAATAIMTTEAATAATIGAATIRTAEVAEAQAAASPAEVITATALTAPTAPTTKEVASAALTSTAKTATPTTVPTSTTTAPSGHRQHSDPNFAAASAAAKAAVSAAVAAATPQSTPRTTGAATTETTATPTSTSATLKTPSPPAVPRDSCAPR